MSGTKKWLTVVFSYNRARLLKNAVRSIDRFFPHGDRLIVDDGSSDPRVTSYLRELAARSNWRVMFMERSAARMYGGLYTNMRRALETAVQEDYDYCYFFEDDEQFVWRKDDYEKYVDNIFERCPDAIQIQSLFQRRILSYSRSMEYIAAARAYRSDRGFTSTGIWNLAAVRDHPDYRVICRYGDELGTNSAYWLRRGYRLYIEFDPTVAVIPWVKSYGRPGVKVRGEEFAPSGGDGEFLLKPLSPAEIEFLRNRPPMLAAYQEHFDLSHENCVRPIWHQAGQSLNRYYFCCRQTVDDEDRVGQSPTRIPVLREWAPSEIAPNESHLNRDPKQKTMIRPRGDRFVPAPLKPARRAIAQWRRFKLRDYMGYRELTKRLSRERRALPYGAESVFLNR